FRFLLVAGTTDQFIEGRTLLGFLLVADKEGPFDLIDLLGRLVLEDGLQLIAAEIYLDEACRLVDLHEVGIILKILHGLFDAAVVEGAELLLDGGGDEIDGGLADEEAQEESDSKAGDRAPQMNA